MFLMYWIVPLMTWLKVALRLRTIGEHYGIEYDHMLRQTRTTYPSLIERLLIAPKNIGYHLDHHLYPSVPFYNLPELHRELQQHEAFRTQAHLTRTYAKVIDECSQCVATPIQQPV
jgi:fatty acid desaturase